MSLVSSRCWYVHACLIWHDAGGVAIDVCIPHDAMLVGVDQEERGLVRFHGCACMMQRDTT
jgi:hypothetical protein